MPSGFSDDHAASYGPIGFAAALIDILVLEFLTWFFLPYWFMLPVTVLPAVIVNAVVAYGLTRGRGTVAQVGRGMLIGGITAPITPARVHPHLPGGAQLRAGVSRRGMWRWRRDLNPRTGVTRHTLSRRAP